MDKLHALLLTDIVDSTQWSERLGDRAAATLWAAHDRLARDLLRAWQGLEIDHADGFLLLFASADQAVACALAYHRALGTLGVPLQARAGVHLGPVVLRRNDAADVTLGAKPVEVDGVAKAIAARVMAVANGGQTLLTAATRAALEPTRWRPRSHGHWRMKGLPEPIELFEVGDDESRFTAPVDGAKAYRVVHNGDLWLPLAQVRHRLPADRDAFVGRSEPLLELARRFEAGARAVSVLGVGGSGKTRLATRFGWTRLGDFPGGVWFCDLSSARGPDGIVNAVAQGLDIPPGRDDPIVRLGDAIAGRGRCLVILDNFEQVARHAPQTLGRWLDMTAEAQFLVTTREVLGLPGEQAFALAPMPDDEATELFRQRAAAACGDFRLGGDDAAALAELVGLLDGLPLAVELAAARVRVMSPRMLLARMGERLRLLASHGGRQDRQATLRATFDWSWDLLTPPERCALAQLAVFDGGFSLAAAEALLDLCACAPAPWVVDILQSLVDKSFVRPVGEARFDLLHSVQAYAAEHLAAPERFPGSGPAALAAAQRRHGEWFASLGPQRAVEGGCADLANLVSACRRSIVLGYSPLAVNALRGAWAALRRHGPFGAGAELAAAVAAMSGLDDGAAAQARLVQGSAAQALGRMADARQHYRAALGHASAAGDAACQADALAGLATLDANENRLDEAVVGHHQALALARRVGHHVAECTALNGLGNVEVDRGRFDAARAHYEAGLVRARQAGDLGWQCALLGNLGMLYANIGVMDDARRCLEQTLDLTRRIGDRQREGNTLCNLGMLHLVQRSIEQAVDVSTQALQVACDLGHRRLEGTVRCNLGLALEASGRAQEALPHFDAALRAVRELGDRRSEGQFLGYQGRTLARLGQVEHARECFAAGLALLQEVADPFGLGVLLADRAECEWQAGDADAAWRAFDEARRHATGAGPESELGQALEKVQRLLARGGAAATRS